MITIAILMAEEMVPEPIQAFSLGGDPMRLESNKRSSTASNAELQPSPPAHKKTQIRSLPTIREHFDPCTVPPNFNYSRIHGKSRRVLQLQAKFDEDNESLEDYCPCCNYPIDGEQFPLFCDIKRLNELGQGFPLYYDMVKFLIFMLAAALLLAGVYNLVKNYKEDRISEHDGNLSGHLILIGTLGTR